MNFKMEFNMHIHDEGRSFRERESPEHQENMFKLWLVPGRKRGHKIGKEKVMLF